MKISRLEIKATIPTRQYENIQPLIELTDVDLAEATAFGEDYILGLISKYSEHGPLGPLGKLNVEKGELGGLGLTTTIVKQSFNEDFEVTFNPEKHEFKYKDQTLVSATNYIKKFYREFDAVNVGKASAKAWGVSEIDVGNLWKSNGEVTSEFGTLIHKLLEHYDKFKAVGNTIAAKKELAENYALPKHPFLRKLILDLAEVNTYKGESVNEALITDIKTGFCGLADKILITGDRKCRIQDYKINIDSDKVDKNLKPLAPFSELPATKLTKYQLQMSFYANMLQKSGWTVEGLDAFVYEDEWKHYELPVVKVI